jgi:uncharacterized protein
MIAFALDELRNLMNFQKMLLYQRLGITDEQLAQFCQRASIVEFALFGSILRDDFRPESDIDILVTFAPDCKLSLLEFVGLEQDLVEWLDRPVDLVEKQVVEADFNEIRRAAILGHYQVIYESRSIVFA